MQALLSLSNGIDAVSKKFGQIADYLVLICSLICAGNAIVRYLFSMSSNGWLEIQWYMFGAMVLLGASYTLKMNEHVRVDLVYGSVSARARLWIDIIGITLFLLPVSILFAVLCWPFFFSSIASCFTERTGAGALDAVAALWSTACEQSSNAGGLIRWPVKILLVLGFLLLALQGLSELIKRIAALKGAVEVDTTYEKPLQ
ncbi:TRAP transporter small permease subunit [Rhizobium sp. FKL33]|uniref:TRAP transporter small permease subunit n=1 Tax=Rhizobium sp. FKL33 TaxID=2562307 RepID=UPI0010C03833|nr:TRAP transporter small permease subunit [Rhizobium sp. FKL33]